MGYERNTRDRHFGDYYGRPNSQDYGRDYSSSGAGYSSAREYEAAGGIGADRERVQRDHGRDQGRDESPRYGQREQGRGYGDQGGRYEGSYRGGYQGGYQGDRHEGGRGGRDDAYHGSYASDGRRFEDVGRYRHADDDNRDARGQTRGGGQSYGRQPQGYDYDGRGFFARAGDEVRSWFGDDEAERRREADSRHDEGSYGDRARGHRDDDYHSWRRSQIDALDRDYDEYRRENQSKFHTEFSSWRTERQTQRGSLAKVEEHMDVVGSDGDHVGTVDKVRGDRILLTKTDKDAGGVHHSIPSRWIQSVDTRVTLARTGSDAKAAWKDEERSQAMFGYGDNARGGADQAKPDDATAQGDTVNKSGPGTY